MQDLDGMKDEVERTKKELDEMTKSILIMEDDQDMWRSLFEDCNKKQGQEMFEDCNKKQGQEAGLQTTIGTDGVENRRGEGDTCKE